MPLWFLTPVPGDKCLPGDSTLQLGPLPSPQRQPHLPAAQHTFPWLLQHCSHQHTAQGLGILGAKRSEGSHEVSGRRLGEGQDLRTEKAGGGDSGEGNGEQESPAALARTRLRKSCSARRAALV